MFSHKFDVKFLHCLKRPKIRTQAQNLSQKTWDIVRFVPSGDLHHLTSLTYYTFKMSKPGFKLETYVGECYLERSRPLHTTITPDLIKHSTDVIDLKLYNDSTVVIYDRRGSTRLATDFPAASTKMT